MNFTEPQAEFIRSCVEPGDYNNASELVREALPLWKAQKDDQLVRVEKLRAELQMGPDGLESGRHIEFTTDEEFHAMHEYLCRSGRERLAMQQHAKSASN